MAAMAKQTGTTPTADRSASVWNRRKPAFGSVFSRFS
jgi:hypothetical protein